MRMGIMGVLWSAPIADAVAIAVTAVVVIRVWQTMGMETHSGWQAEKKHPAQRRPKRAV